MVPSAIRTLPSGNGVLLWFEVDDFDAAVARAENCRRYCPAPPSQSARWQRRSKSLGALAARSRRLYGRACQPGRISGRELETLKAATSAGIWDPL